MVKKQIKKLPTKQISIDSYLRVKGGKQEVVRDHNKDVHYKPPQISEKKKDAIKKGKAKKLIDPEQYEKKRQFLLDERDQKIDKEIKRLYEQISREQNGYQKDTYTKLIFLAKKIE